MIRLKDLWRVMASNRPVQLTTGRPIFFLKNEFPYSRSPFLNLIEKALVVRGTDGSADICFITLLTFSDRIVASIPHREAHHLQLETTTITVANIWTSTVFEWNIVILNISYLQASQTPYLVAFVGASGDEQGHASSDHHNMGVSSPCVDAVLQPSRPHSLTGGDVSITSHTMQSLSRLTTRTLLSWRSSYVHVRPVLYATRLCSCIVEFVIIDRDRGRLGKTLIGIPPVMYARRFWFAASLRDWIFNTIAETYS